MTDDPFRCAIGRLGPFPLIGESFDKWLEVEIWMADAVGFLTFYLQKGKFHESPIRSYCRYMGMLRISLKQIMSLFGTVSPCIALLTIL